MNQRSFPGPSVSSVTALQLFIKAPGRLQLVNLAAGLAVKEAVEKLHSVRLSLKWPNDLLWENKKICGILSEASSESDRVRDCCTGIGLNISPPSLEYNGEAGDILSKASFLSEIVGAVHRGQLTAAILDCFSERLVSMESDGGSSLLLRYREECTTLGRDIIVSTDEGKERGRALNISDNGELVVLTERGPVTYCAADVVHATPEKR